VWVADVLGAHRAVVAEAAHSGERAGREDPAELPEDGAVRQRPAAGLEGDRGAEDAATFSRDPDPRAPAMGAREDAGEGDAVGDPAVAAALRADGGPDRVVGEGLTEDAGGAAALAGVGDDDLRSDRDAPGAQLA